MQRRYGKYTQLNTQFQRIARRNRKALLSEQCKEIEENNRMGKTRYVFKKIRDTKGTFHAKMGTKRAETGLKRSRRHEEEMARIHRAIHRRSQ